MCLVRFPDGELMAAYFFGGPEVVVPLLFPLDSAEEVFAGGMEPLMERLDADDGDRPEPFDTEPVQIWSAYGATFWWEGRASKSAAVIVEGVDPRGVAAEMGDPTGEEPREVHDGAPDWVPEEWRSTY